MENIYELFNKITGLAALILLLFGFIGNVFTRFAKFKTLFILFNINLI